MASGWRYLAATVTGDGSEGTPVELPFLTDVVITERLSGPPQITGTVPVEVSQMRDADGRPLFQEWGTAIYAEDPNGALYGGILIDSEFQGQKWLLDCAGFSYYPKDQPWVWEDSWIEVDPLEVHRVIWDRFQSLPHGDLGVRVEVVQSPVRIGSPEMMPAWERRLRTEYLWESGPVHRVHVDERMWSDLLANGWTVGEPDDLGELLVPPEDSNSGSYRVEAKPFTMSWFETFDCGALIDQLAAETPFDWVEAHAWDGDEIRHTVNVGYPRIGRRRTDLRFAVGENVIVLPTARRTGADYASNVLILGQGEGRDRVAGDVANYTGRPRRVVVIDDKTITDRDEAVNAARREQAWRNAPITVTDLELVDHPNAPIGSISLGDEVWLEGWTGWVDLAMWVRVVEVSISPARSDRIKLTVQRADRGV